jgi:ferredoxin-NADP reductase
VTLALPIREVLTATPRARIVRLDLAGRTFVHAAGQAVVAGVEGSRKRPYSIANAPEDVLRDGCIELLVGVDVSGTPGPHLPLVRGTVVEVDGPLGSFTFPSAPPERHFLFIAGGTGIAPLRAMLRHALTVPHDHIGLFYSARTPEEFAYETEWRGLAADGRIEFQQTVTRAHDEATWSGARGRIDRTLLRPLVHHAETLAFICGPPTLVAEMSALLAELGVSESRICVERW